MSTLISDVSLSSPERGDVSRLLTSAQVCTGEPRRPSCRESRAASCGEPRVGEPLALDGINETSQSLKRVALYIPLVEAERKLIDVAKQMLLGGVMVDAVQTAFKDSPDALDAVGRYRPTRVCAEAIPTVKG